jgi:hypothetical protein
MLDEQRRRSKGWRMTELPEREQQRARAAKNQSLFREVNERIEDLASAATFTSFVCECLDTTCVEPIPLMLQEYEAIRAGGNCFVVMPGHEVPQVEEVTEVTDRYYLVSKLGAGAPTAKRLDPRTRSVR